jgi:tetratricopeptide (TPR) repeat protein
LSSLKPVAVLSAIAFMAIALWPMLGSRHAEASRLHTPSATFTMAPITRDYLTRNKVIAFYEARVKYDPTDQISLNQLSQQYLQRYRESGDIDDVKRAEAAARKSLAAQPHYNAGAQFEIASALLTLHRFSEALNTISTVPAFGNSANANLDSHKAGLEMELGDYAKAKRLLDRIPPSTVENGAVDTVRARYAELTGSLKDARILLELAQQQQDSIFDAPAQARAWYHEREGEMAFNSGDTQSALADEEEALSIFPNFAMADNAMAKFALAQHDYQTAYSAAAKGAAIVPLPETVGYQADAAEGLGHHDEAARLRDLIFTIQRIGNTYHTSDRLLSVYYSEHGIRLADALTIAKREIDVRGNEIYAQDTLAWAEAMNGDWVAARNAMNQAIRYDTEDPKLQYHAGVIAMHFHNSDEAKRRFSRALALNPQFHPIYADDARKRLAQL